MEGFKHFLKIVLFTLLGLLGLVIILAILTALIPNFYIFGYKMVVGSSSQDEKVIEYAGQTAYKINLRCESYKVNIIADENLEGLLGYSYKGSNFGFANMQKARLIEEVGDNTLNLSMREPTGAVIKNGDINIRVNPNVTYDLSLISEKGNISVTGLNIEHINFVTTSGDINVKAIVKENAEGETGTETSLTLKSLNIKTESGKVDFLSYDNVTIESVGNITLGNGSLKLNNLNGSLNIRGGKCSFKANNINANDNFNMICASGSFSAGDINLNGKELILVSDDCSVKAKNVVANVGLTLSKGNVEFKTITGETIIKDAEGNISVEKAMSNIFIVGGSGKIFVEEYYRVGQFVSTSGNISVKSVSDYNSKLYSTIATVSGVVNFENKINTSSISVSGEGMVRAKIWNVAQSGEVKHEIYIPSGEASIGIMANATDIFRLRLTGQVDGSLNNLILYANDEYIYHPNKLAGFSDQTTFVCTGGVLSFTQLDPQI